MLRFRSNGRCLLSWTFDRLTVPLTRFRALLRRMRASPVSRASTQRSCRPSGPTGRMAVAQVLSR
jgi:hypothetical protein